MRRLSFVIFVLALFFVSICAAGQRGVFFRKNINGGTPSCDTVEQSGGIDNTDMIITDTYTRRSHSFTTVDAYTLCKVVFSMWKTSSPGGDTTIEIWSDDGSGNPNAKLSDIGTALTVSLGTSSGDVTFDGLNISLSATTRYHYVFINTGCDASNTIRIDRTTSGSERTHRYDSTWNIVDNSSALVFTNYK